MINTAPPAPQAAPTHVMIQGGNDATMHPLTAPMQEAKYIPAPSMQVIKATGPDQIGVKHNKSTNTCFNIFKVYYDNIKY